MIKVILVDDEDIERDAMAEIIPWEKLDMELVDTCLLYTSPSPRD